jgi:hypothetical protein
MVWNRPRMESYSIHTGYRANYIILILILFLTFLEALKKFVLPLIQLSNIPLFQLYDFQTGICPTILYGMRLTRHAVGMAGIKKNL